MTKENVKPYLYEIGKCPVTGIKLVYREPDEEMKNHPKYKLIQEMYGKSTNVEVSEEK